ncbi:hypothetical protein VIGAN_03236700 [Vigna angularis var. angularis]|uniref:Uncharacterized protein n=1 Tax=Vigna angularis var. angularis TaxID=157739 RepID=A0A0S3RP65_PHAAN|nr:hypothetical protein VIGAN_03236700 [Vigna angularis var. angularis]
MIGRGTHARFLLNRNVAVVLLDDYVARHGPARGDRPVEGKPDGGRWRRADYVDTRRGSRTVRHVRVRIFKET